MYKQIKSNLVAHWPANDKPTKHLINFFEYIILICVENNDSTIKIRNLNRTRNLINFYLQQYQEEKNEEEVKPGNNSNFIRTRQVNSEEPFYVHEQMLKYRGEKYTEKDIAPIWKKDCRMWLWKTNNRKTANKVA